MDMEKVIEPSINPVKEWLDVIRYEFRNITRQCYQERQFFLPRINDTLDTLAGWKVWVGDRRLGEDWFLRWLSIVAVYIYFYWKLP